MDTQSKNGAIPRKPELEVVSIIARELGDLASSAFTRLMGEGLDLENIDAMRLRATPHIGSRSIAQIHSILLESGYPGVYNVTEMPPSHIRELNQWLEKLDKPVFPIRASRQGQGPRQTQSSVSVSSMRELTEAIMILNDSIKELTTVAKAIRDGGSY